MKNKKFGVLIIGIPIGAILLFWKSLMPSYQESELKVIQAVFQSSYEHAVSKAGNVLSMKLENYTSTFEVGEYNFNSLNKSLFQSSVKKGDEISLVIPKKFNGSEKEPIPVFEISKENLIFIKREDSLSDFSRAQNLFLWGGVISLTIGLFRLLFWFLKK
jgi:hypothetical protein